MKKFFGAATLAAALLLLMSLPLPASAENTQVLPKGHGSIQLGYFYDSISREADDAGRDRELGYTLNHVDLTNIGNAVLQQQIGPLPFDILQYATTSLEARSEAMGTMLAFQYGVTDRLSVGVGMPYFSYARTRVHFMVDAGFTPAAIAAGVDNLILANTTPKGLVQDYLHNVLGYDRIENWTSGPGIGDVVVGAKYRFFSQEMFAMAASGFLSIPTGEPDDERNLTDVKYGTGSYMTGLDIIADVKPADWLTWSMWGGYVFDLPYHRAVYLIDKSDPTFYESEFPTIREFGSYDRGDSYHFATMMEFNVMPGVGPYIGYAYHQAQADRIDGDEMPKTEWILRTMTVGVSASTVEAYQDKKALLPMRFDVHAEAVQSGKKAVREEMILASVSFYF